MKMGKRKGKQEALLQELIAKAKQEHIEVRTERLLREVGYHARSGSCRIKGQDVIIIDRDVPTKDQIDFLAEELKTRESAREESPAFQKSTADDS
jgi:hypothetical protein